MDRNSETLALKETRSPTLMGPRSVDEGEKAMIPVEMDWSSDFSPVSQNSEDPLEGMSLGRSGKQVRRHTFAVTKPVMLVRVCPSQAERKVGPWMLLIVVAVQAVDTNGSTGVGWVPVRLWVVQGNLINSPPSARVYIIWRGGSGCGKLYA